MSEEVPRSLAFIRQGLFQKVTTAFVASPQPEVWHLCHTSRVNSQSSECTIARQAHRSAPQPLLSPPPVLANFRLRLLALTITTTTTTTYGCCCSSSRSNHLFLPRHLTLPSSSIVHSFPDLASSGLPHTSNRSFAQRNPPPTAWNKTSPLLVI